MGEPIAKSYGLWIFLWLVGGIGDFIVLELNTLIGLLPIFLALSLLMPIYFGVRCLVYLFGDWRFKSRPDIREYLLPNHRLSQLHLSTTVILFVMASIFAGFNFTERESEFYGEFRCKAFGFPAEVFRHDFKASTLSEKDLSKRIRGLANEDWENVLFNISCFVVIAVLVALIVESRVKRKNAENK